MVERRKKRPRELRVRVTEGQVDALRALLSSSMGRGCKSERQIVESLIASICDGVFRPGCWERAVVIKVFGGGFEHALEPDPQFHWRLRLRSDWRIPEEGADGTVRIDPEE